MIIGLTGTICSGKTGVADELIKRRYNMREEIARSLIGRRQKQGSNAVPWNSEYADQFQLDLLQLYLSVDPILHYGNNFAFNDTTYLDPLTFLRANQMRQTNNRDAPFSDAEKKAREIIEFEREFFQKEYGHGLPHFQRVFKLEPLDVYEKDPQRQFDAEYARLCDVAKSSIYEKEFGYELVSVPVFQISGENVSSDEKVARSIDKRVEFILDRLPQYK